MKITCSIDKRNLRKLYTYADKLPYKAEKTCKRLVKEIGKPEATANFAKAEYGGDTKVDVTDAPIEPSKNKRGHSLIAKGKSVYYIEFGAGVYYNGSGRYPEPLPRGIGGIGSQGQGRGNNYWWHYPIEHGLGQGGVAIQSDKRPELAITHGNVANNCMYNARLKIQEHAQQILDEELEK